MDTNEPNLANETPIFEPKISFDDFAKVEMRIGRIENAETIEKSEKLLKLSVNFGESLPR